MVNFYHLSLRLGALLLATLPAFSIVSAQDDNSNKKDNGNKEESNRNVMLNAASANVRYRLVCLLLMSMCLRTVCRLPMQPIPAVSILFGVAMPV